jgi:hypothetical protein
MIPPWFDEVEGFNPGPDREDDIPWDCDRFYPLDNTIEDTNDLQD